MFLIKKFKHFANRNTQTTMAIAIKSIPTLENETAQAFVKKADSAVKNRATVDFSKQVEIARAILKKANLK